MEPLAVFKQKDVFPLREDTVGTVSFVDRLTGKAIVFDQEGKIALVGNEVNSFYLLPGGGIDDESVEDGIVRECLEEIGCVVRLGEKVGIVEDYRDRDGKHCITHCYIAMLVGEKGVPQLTAEEAKNGMHVAWFTIGEALEILDREVKQLRNGEVAFYNTGYNILRDQVFLRSVACRHERDLRGRHCLIY